MKYILDNSGLSAFAKIRRLDLLKRIFDNKVVLIPKEVYNEGVIKAKIRGHKIGNALINIIATDERELNDKWILVKQVKRDMRGYINNKKIDLGEAEVIELAKEENAVAVIDEEDGRKAAKGENIKITGTLGLLRAAYENCLIETKTELMELIRLLKESKFRVDDGLVGWVRESKKIN